MKCAGFALTAMLGFAYAAPVEQSWIEPGGDFNDKSLVRRRLPKLVLGKDAEGRRIVDPITSTLFGTALAFAILPLGTRFYNNLLGVQESEGAKKAREQANGGKRSVDVATEDLDLTFDETRKLYISSFVDRLLKESPNGGEAAVCTGVGYRISDPSKTLEGIAVKITAQGQEHKYDCFLLTGPVTFQVNNATDADFIWQAPAGATFSNGVLTIV